VPAERPTKPNRVLINCAGSLGGLVLGLLIALGREFFGMSIVGAIVLLRGRFRAERTERTTIRADLAEGLRFVWQDRLLRVLAAMTGAYNFATNATLAVFVLYAIGPTSAMGLSEQAYGLLLATIAAGSVIGSFTTELVTRRLGRVRALALAVPGGALLVGIPAVTSNPYVVGAGFFLGGVANIVWNVIVVSLRQQLAGDRLIGRVNSAYRLVAWGMMPLGAAAGGILAQFVGLRAVFVVMAVIMLVMTVGMRTVAAYLPAAEQRTTGRT